jgi:hypothetical protein
LRKAGDPPLNLFGAFHPLTGLLSDGHVGVVVVVACHHQKIRLSFDGNLVQRE